MTARPEALADLRFQRLCVKMHALGPRALAEFLAELGAERLIRFRIEKKLERYAALDPAVLRALGADQLPHPQPPIHLVAKNRGDLS